MIDAARLLLSQRATALRGAGLRGPGEAPELIDDNQIHRRWVVNPSGGLISAGHPLGATGLCSARS